MYLFELDQGAATVSKIVALTNQLQNDIDQGEVNTADYTVDDLLDYFQKYDIILDVTDLYNMIKVPPLKTLIKNIQGDKVVFKGHEGEPTKLDKPPGADKDVVSKMAQHAMKI